MKPCCKFVTSGEKSSLWWKYLHVHVHVVASLRVLGHIHVYILSWFNILPCTTIHVYVYVCVCNITCIISLCCTLDNLQA